MAAVDTRFYKNHGRLTRWALKSISCFCARHRSWRQPPRYEFGRDVLAELYGVPADARQTGYAFSAPAVERLLKERPFAGLFERAMLSWRESELAAVPALAGVRGVEPMAAGRKPVCCIS